jgi:hypothetical protein
VCVCDTLDITQLVVCVCNTLAITQLVVCVCNNEHGTIVNWLQLIDMGHSMHGSILLVYYLVQCNMTCQLSVIDLAITRYI